MKTIHFKNKKEYEKWIRYIYEHDLEKRHKKPKVYIHGKKHKVNHKKR